MYLLFILACWLLPTDSIYSSNHSITLKVTNLQSEEGTIRVVLCNDDAQWLSLSQHYITKDCKVEGQKECKLTFENIPSGTYAISLYHDENNNGALDLGVLRIPKEPYGFSNNPSSMFGPASFEDASFQLYNDLTLTIKL